MALKPELEALIERSLKSLEVDVDEIEKRIMLKLEHRMFQLLVQADVLPQQALDEFEKRYRIGLRRDSEVAARALGMIEGSHVGS